MNTPLLLSIDQGTTSSRAMLFETDGSTFALAQQEYTQYYPAIGWVEHDPEEIWSTTLQSAREVLAQAAAASREVIACGITNQRETVLVWDRSTGQTIHKAIVWQDRRTAERCHQLHAAGCEEQVTASTGLLLDPYFSATKIAWILDHVEGARERAERGELAFGTVDSFLIWRLSGGERHVTDATNASRTLLFNIHEQRWDESLCELFGVPMAMLPEVLDCAADFGTARAEILGQALPIAGVAGDQHAASIGQACFQPGMIKSTYGTGCFMMLNIGQEAVTSKHRLLTTVAYRLGGQTTYALEGSIFIAGAAVQWLRDGLGIIDSAAETAALAESVPDSHGVYLVPAFTGLGAPWWDPDARGAIFGLSRDSGPAALARATLESVAYQTHDLLTAMRQDGASIESLRVDGGMIKNDWLAQFLSSVLDIKVERPLQTETTALGAAYLAGLQCGVYQSLDELASHWHREREFLPAMLEDDREQALAGWADAIRRTRTHYSG